MAFEQRPTTLVVGDDYPLYVEALCRHIEADDRFVLGGVAVDGDGAVRACETKRPGVALVGWFLFGARGGHRVPAPRLLTRRSAASDRCNLLEARCRARQTWTP